MPTRPDHPQFPGLSQAIAFAHVLGEVIQSPLDGAAGIIKSHHAAFSHSYRNQSKTTRPSQFYFGKPRYADALVVLRSQDPRVEIIEYDVQGKILATGVSYDNRFISMVTIDNRKIVPWRDYLDSLAAMTALNQAVPDTGD